MQARQVLHQVPSQPNTVSLGLPHALFSLLNININVGLNNNTFDVLIWAGLTILR